MSSISEILTAINYTWCSSPSLLDITVTTMHCAYFYIFSKCKLLAAGNCNMHPALGGMHNQQDPTFRFEDQLLRLQRRSSRGSGWAATQGPNLQQF